MEVERDVSDASVRNLALSFAADLGGSWAITIEANEVVHFPGYASTEDLMSALHSDSSVQTWLVPIQNSQYAKARFVRLPLNLPREGAIHGCFEVPRLATLPGAHFSERRRNSSEVANLLLRDRRILEARLAADPRNAQNWMLLGNTLEAQNEIESSIAAFMNCGRYSKCETEVSWACYKAACRLYVANRFEQALAHCMSNCGDHPVPELTWLASHCLFRLHRYSEALEQSRRSISGAEQLSAANHKWHDCYRFLPAWYEAPHELMRLIFQRLDLSQAASKAHQAYLVARNKRLKQLEAQCLTDKAGIRRVFIDLGTHYGEGLARLARLIPLDPTWEIHTFEPNPACHSGEKLVRFHLPTNFHQAAAWIRDGEAEFIQEEPRISRSGSPSDGGARADGWASCLSGVRLPDRGLDKQLTVKTVNLARILTEFDPAAEIIVKMDIEGAEFAVLRHLVNSGAICRINRLFVEWHDRFAVGETAESRMALQSAIAEHNVDVVPWD